MSISVINSPLEGDSMIIKIECLKLKCYHNFITFFTLGLSILLSYWFQDFERLVYFSKVQDIEQASHFWIEDSNKNKLIVQKKYQYQFYYFMLKYTYNPLICAFEVLQLQINSCQQIRQNYIDSDISVNNVNQIKELEQIYGQCILQLDKVNIIQNKENILVTFMKEIFHPFQVFQIFSCIVWIIDDYYLFATIILIISFLSSFYNLLLIRQNKLQLQQMSLYKNDINVYRMIENYPKIIKISSQNIVPGDIILFDYTIKLPCDCIIINGDAIVNECSLTGETIPVRKSQIQNEITQNNTLFEGTELIQCLGNLKKFDNKLAALVIKTNFITIKGILIRNMSLPKTDDSQFRNDSQKFIAILGIFTLIGFLIILNRFQGYMAYNYILLQLFELVTVTIPPTLTIALSMGIMAAMQNLKKANIFCISPGKIIDGGEIDTVCFDKTGTLTQNHMKLKQYLSVINNKIKYSNGRDEVSLVCMALCNSLILNQNSVQGDHMEVAMYNYSNASYREQSQDIQILSQQWKQVIRFDFINELERMSVIAENKNGKQFIYTKGSPEKLKLLIKKIPENYDNQIKKQAQKGYRLLALAYREIYENEVKERENLEKDLYFLGFVLLENELKSDSLQTIIELNNAQIDVKMITGDNILTAVNVAQQCNISNQQLKCLDLDENFNLQIDNIDHSLNQSAFQNSVENYEFQFGDQTDIYNTSFQNSQSLNETIKSFKFLNAFSVNQIEQDSSILLDQILQQNDKEKRYAITGKLFNRLKHLDEFQNFIPQIQVFARMSPELKIQVVSMLQKTGKRVAMVGDGANDCGALKQANIGLSLSETEASIAAPFTARDLNVSSIITLIKESRAGLVSAFQIFKFISLYSQIQFSTMLVLYNQWSQLSSLQFIYIDMFTVVPLFMTLSLTQSYENLSVQKPNCNLLQIKNMVSVFSQILLQLGGFFFFNQRTNFNYVNFEIFYIF